MCLGRTTCLPSTNLFQWVSTIQIQLRRVDLVQSIIISLKCNNNVDIKFSGYDTYLEHPSIDILKANVLFSGYDTYLEHPSIGILKANVLERQITLKYLGAWQQNGLNSIAKIDYGLICLRKIWFWFLVFNATVSNISVMSWRPVVVVEEAGVPGENHRPCASNW